MAAIFTKDNFSVLNKKGKDILYYTDQPSYNELTVSFLNISEVDITLVGGEEPSVLQFSMAFLRDGDQDPVKDFTFAPSEYFEPILLLKRKWAEWKLVCKKDVVIPAGKSISFTIKNILLISYNPGNFYITASGITGYEDIDATAPMAYGLVVKDLDSETSERLPIAIDYTDVIHPINNQTGQPCTSSVTKSKPKVSSSGGALPIYITYDSFSQIKNGFRLILTIDEDIIIPDIVNHAKKPAIRIMFLFGDYSYQITTPKIGNDIEINSNQLNWKVNHDESYPFWECIPLPQTIKAFTTFSFDINRIVTPLDAKVGVSMMYVQLNNFANFADEVKRFQLIKKVAEPKIVSFKKDKDRITIGENVKLSWNTELASKLEITYKTREDQLVVLSTAPKPGEHKILLTQCEFIALPVPPTAVITTFEATAYGPNNSQSATSITMDVKQKTAEIQSFIATPAFTTHGVKTKVVLSWDVRDASQLMLVKGDVEIDVSKTASKEIEVDSPTEYKLIARSYGDELPNASKTLALYTSKVQTPVPLNFEGDQAGDRPKALLYRNDKENNRYLFAHCGQNKLFQVDVLNFRKLMVINNKRGQFALHPTSLYLVAFYNGRDGKYIYGQAQDGRWPETYQYGGVNNYVTDMKFSPDGEKLFFTFVEGDGTVKDENKQQQIAVSQRFNKSQDRLTYLRTSYAVGIGSPTIAFDSGSDNVYFSSYAEKQMYHAKYNQGDTLTVKKATILQEKVVAITESKTVNAAGKVFLLSADDGPIVMYDREFAGSTASKVFDLGGYPMDMLLSTDEKTLYVACIKSNKVVLVDIVDSSKQISFAVDTPSCLALSSNGNLLFVGSHRSKSLAVINLKNGNMSPLISLGEDSGNPMVLTVCEEKDRYLVYITKESYSERTKWTGAEVIKKNTNLDLGVVAIYK